MNSKVLIPAAIVLMSVSGFAVADEPKPDDDGEVTITLMPPGNGAPELVMKQIELPDLDLDNETANAKVGKAREALEKAEQKGNAGREHGWSHAADAHDARDQAQEMAENAKAKNEDRGRSEDRPDRPEPPGRPETPPGRN